MRFRLPVAILLKCDIIDPGCDGDELRRTIIELFGRTDGEEEEAEIGEEEED